MTNAGKLNKRITIQQITNDSPAKNALGEPSTSWSDFATVWARIVPITGREFWAQQQGQSETTTRIEIRYLIGVTQEMRVVYGSKIFNIRDVKDLEEKHVDMHLMCSEGVNDG